LIINIIEEAIMQLYSKQHIVGMLEIIKKLAVISAIAALLASPAIHSEEFRGHEGAREHREAARGRDHHIFALRDVHRFNHAELELWRGGRWDKSCFLGRCGWWWFAEGQWYFYEHRVGPYPLMVSDVIYIEPFPAAPVVVAPQAPVMVAPAPVVVAPQPPPQAAAQTWSYCESSKTYYPYVQICPEGWKSVPAQPQAVPR
jgi:hypothetical protein